MTFATLKAALGWYATRCKGGRLAQQNPGERVQESKIQSDAQHMEMAQVLAGISPGNRRLLLQWADKSDEAVHLGPQARRSMARVARELRARGYLEQPVQPVSAEPREFVDLNTGEVRRTKGAG